MTTSSSTRATSTEPYSAPTRNPLFSALIGLASVAVFLQAVWAGMMIREGREFNEAWVEIHDWGARVAFVLALAATIVGVIKLRTRRDLVAGAAAMTVLIFLESYIGGTIGDDAGAIAFHIPIAFAIFGLAVWIPMRAMRSA
jgi:heme A synthase